MNRREAVSTVAMLLGGTIVGANLFIETGCNPTSKKVNELFDEEHLALLDEIAETILPATKTPGAKAAKVGAFITVMVKDCYSKEDQKVFIAGISKLQDACNEKFDKKFMECSPAQRTQLLTQLDAEQKEHMKKKKPEEANHYFRMMKELTLLGFFTSEVASTQALRYVAVPGKYDGYLPYKKGDRAWAT